MFDSSLDVMNMRRVSRRKEMMEEGKKTRAERFGSHIKLTNYDGSVVIIPASLDTLSFSQFQPGCYQVQVNGLYVVDIYEWTEEELGLFLHCIKFDYDL